MDHQRVINVNNWHYRYYSWLLRMWSGNTNPPRRLSLCRYFQSMLWLSIAVIPVLPFSLFGIIAQKTAEYLLQTRLAGFLERIAVKQMAELSQEDIKKAPIGLGAIGSTIWLSYLILALIIVGSGALVICLLPAVIREFPDVLHKILLGLKIVLLYVGWSLFYGFYSIGWALHWTTFVFSYVLRQLADNILLIVEMIGYFSLISIGCISVTLILFKIMESESIQSMLDGWIKKAEVRDTKKKGKRAEIETLRRHKLNDEEQKYHAKKEMLYANRREAIIENLPRWRCDNCGLIITTNKTISCTRCCHQHPLLKMRLQRAYFAGLRFRRQQQKTKQKWTNDKGQSFELSSVFALLKDSFWAIKHRICPTLVVMTTDEIQASQQPSSPSSGTTNITTGDSYNVVYHSHDKKSK